MEGKLDFLKNNLREQLKLYRQMLEVVRKEKDCLINLDLKQIRECTYEKAALSDDAAKTEAKRQQWVAALADQHSINREELTVERIVDLLDKTQYEELVRIKTGLVHMIKKVHEQNYENQDLVQRALQETQTMKQGILGMTSSKAKTYGPQGKVNDKEDSAARMFEQQA